MRAGGRRFYPSYPGHSACRFFGCGPRVRLRQCGASRITNGESGHDALARRRPYELTQSRRDALAEPDPDPERRPRERVPDRAALHACPVGRPAGDTNRPGSDRG